ncbi:hypothetical protein CEXT_630541 [Caerostris extrusa]|uniref:Uncharacterized protein n=1 Tax=Caerostris extrusa TaxID=172846 RepID=A0AAV4W2J7_CAEEX|nr:hypothetical protein CEXT_630541 [Caerostris extrusa]
MLVVLRRFGVKDTARRTNVFPNMVIRIMAAKIVPFNTIPKYSHPVRPGEDVVLPYSDTFQGASSVSVRLIMIIAMSDILLLRATKSPQAPWLAPLLELDIKVQF